MDYAQTLDYLYSRLPMFTRDGASAFKKDLRNTVELCKYLGNPQHQFKSIHIAGTNGKGSTSHMLAAVLQKSGYKTALYTSPHLLDFRERIRINGQMIPQQEVVQWVHQHQHRIEDIQPSFFELTVAMAFDYFAQQKVDVAVVEVGLGGLLDSTNILQPDLSVITNISFDHMNLLGNTLSEIAFQKAGIIKSHTPVVVGERQNETDIVFERVAHECKAPLFFAQDGISVDKLHWDFKYLYADVIDLESKECWFTTLASDLKGTYQSKNIITVLATIKQLRKLGYRLPDILIREALGEVQRINALQGRWQIIQSLPQVIVDTGHNEAGVREVLQNLAQTTYHKLHLVLGMVADKDVAKVISLFPENATYYFCKADLPRSMTERQLQQIAAESNRIGEAFETVAKAIQAALQAAQAHDLVFVGGSTFVVAEALAEFQTR